MGPGGQVIRPINCGEPVTLVGFLFFCGLNSGLVISDAGYDDISHLRKWYSEEKQKPRQFFNEFATFWTPTAGASVTNPTRLGILDAVREAEEESLF